jgi:arginase
MPGFVHCRPSRGTTSRAATAALVFAAVVFPPTAAHAQKKYTGADGHLRVALAKQPFSPNGTSRGPTTMADGGVQDLLKRLGATIRIDEAALTDVEDGEYGGWKRLGMALGHYAKIVERNERDGVFNIGLYATCPSMPGMVAGLQHSGPTLEPIRVGMLWLDAHPDFNTPETTRSGSLGGMPVAVATGRALWRMRIDATLDPPLSDRNVVMGGVRLTDPLEQMLLDDSDIEQLSVDDLRTASPAVFAQLDRLARNTDKLYIHIDMDVLDPAEVPGHGNKVPGGPSSAELASLFEKICARYPTASAIGCATIPSDDPGGVSLAAVNRMIEGAVRGVIAREGAARTPAPRDQSVKKPASSRRNPGSTSSPSTLSLSRSSRASPPGR